MKQTVIYRTGSGNYFSNFAKSLLMLLLTAFYVPLQAQITESFESGIVAVGAPVTHLPAGWTYTVLNGTNGLPNCADVVILSTAGSYPSLPSIYDGLSALRYNTRAIIFPNNNISTTQSNDRVIVVTRQLDWSGRDTAGISLNQVISLRFYRDPSTAGGVDLANDNLEVYVNNSPDTLGAIRLTDIATGADIIPRSANLFPTYPGGGWQLLTYNLPAQVPGPGGSKFDTTSTGYVIFKFTSNQIGPNPGGNNMFIDSVFVPEWKTDMVVTHAEMIYQNTSTVSPGSKNNIIVGLKIVTKGSNLPKKLDRIVFYTNGSSNFSADVDSSFCYFTHDTSYWAPPPNGNGQRIPHISVPGSIQPLDFGNVSNFSPCTFGTLPAWLLKPGTENYVWLIYHIKSTATAGNFVDADVAFFMAGTANCATTIGCIPSTLPGGILIDVSYPIPTYTTGTRLFNYNFLNDYISAVDMQGYNNTKIDNWYHDLTVGAPCNTNCNRFSAHPPDYTLFPAVNNGLHRNRLVQVKMGNGKRTNTPPDTLKVAAGSWFFSNNTRVFIDWNKDGDFSDVYMKPGGTVADSIREDFLCSGCTNGQWSLGQGNLTAPFSAGSSYGTWLVNVPDINDIVKDRAKSGSNGPMVIGPVRLRVRNAFATSDISPSATYSMGEVEDYTVQVLENCPEIGSNVCKWLGATSDWDNPINWCPAIPTINDIAFIPVMSGTTKYPAIDSGTVAVCRTLKIDNGAQVIIDCPYSTGLQNDSKGSLRVADSLIIGVGSVTSTSNLKVISDLTKTVTVPGAVSTSGNPSVSFFGGNANRKIQISYTANELYNVFGWRPGDIIDSLRLVFQSTSNSAATFPNFRIVKYETSYPVTWGNPLPLNVDTAVFPGKPCVIGGAKYVFGTSNSGYSINMNLPSNGSSFLIIPLTQGWGTDPFIWEGNNMVLSFEYFATSASGMQNYILYTEPSSTYNVLGLYCNNGVVPANNSLHINSGYNLSGYRRSIGVPNNFVNGTVNSGSYGASNQRPRIDFIMHRPYTKFPITVGKAFVNNSNTGSPVGANGFIAGKSKVTFDPLLRAGVNSPGLATMTNVWNPTLQSQTLSTLNDTLTITSGQYALGGTGYIAGTASTVFNELEIKSASSGISSIVKQRFDTYADSLTMTSGELNLNKKLFTLKGSSAYALTSVGGWIRSEDSATARFESRLMWQIGANSGNYKVPFGISNSLIFPVQFYATSGDFGDVEFATYGTPNTNNTKMPVAPVAVTSMNTNPLSVVDATPWTVDRFWFIRRSTTTAIEDSIIFAYPASEGTVSAGYSAGNMRAQRYSKSTSNGNWGWNDPNWFSTQRDFINGSIVYVKANADDLAGLTSDSGYVWTVVSLFNGQGPLPVELISFNAKQMDQKVKIWWDVQSESDVAKYTVERTKDYSFTEDIASALPIGPSSAVLHYEAWDLNPFKGLQYYRLRTQDVDGSKYYSKYVPVNFNGEGLFEITSVTANTDNGKLDVTFKTDTPGPYSFILTDAMAKVIFEGRSIAVAGENKIEIPAQISTGLYFISIMNSEKKVTSKFRF